MLAAIDLAALAAIFGILGGAATVGSFVLKWREHQRPDHSHPREALALVTAEDMVELKALVDIGWLGVLSHGQNWWERPALAGNYDALGQLGRKMLGRSARIDTSYGPKSRPARAVREAINAAEEIFNALDRIRIDREDQPMDEHAELQVRHYFEEDRERIRTARNRFASAGSVRGGR